MYIYELKYNKIDIVIMFQFLKYGGELWTNQYLLR